jgi:tetratricopeptide (TPR) repeat protein
VYNVAVRLLRIAFAVVAVSACMASRPCAADEDQDARAHFAAGKAHYENGRYADALKDFQESFRLSRRPELAYNIGVCQERLGEYAAAIVSYRLYLKEVPDSPDRDTVAARIAFLQHVGLGSAPPARSRRGLAIALSIVGAVVAAGVAVGLGVGLSVGSAPAQPYTPSTLGLHPGSF